jgi:death-on-curing protein
VDEPLNPLFLDVETVKFIHADQIDRYGGSPGLLQNDGLESAIHAPQNLWYYSEESDLFDLAACYCSHLALNHPFEDGNKRTALAAALKFLSVNGVDPSRRKNSSIISDEYLAGAVVTRIEKTTTDADLAQTLFITVGPKFFTEALEKRLDEEAIARDSDFKTYEEAHAFVVDMVISTLGVVSIDLCQQFWINPKRLEPALLTCQKELIEKVNARYQAQFGMTIDGD